jgi:hypothetical protein
VQADWEFEIGGDAPVIDACWSGYVDLRRHPERIAALPEALLFPPLAEMLVRLNLDGSPVWTSKCDFFPSLDAAQFDADEMDAAPEDALYAVACYIDLLPVITKDWREPKLAAAACKHVCGALDRAAMLNCRADLVVRTAVVAEQRESVGVTAYITACGATGEQARSTLAEALAVFADAVVSAGVPRQLQ